MANQEQNANYRPGVNRNVTKKWAQATRPAYDDWDDSDGYDPDEPVQLAPGQDRRSWDTRSQGASSQGGYSNPPGQYHPSNRSVTGPASTGRASLDRGDERRHLANVGGAQGAYPTAQRDPFEDIQHDYQPNFDPQLRGNHGQPSLQLQTGGRPSMEQRQHQQGTSQGSYIQGAYSQGPYTAGPGSSHFQEPRGASPFSAPAVGPSGRRSQSSGRPAPGDIYRGESPMRPGSQNSRGGSPSRAFPPRKSSLSQQKPPPEIQQYGAMAALPMAQSSTPSSEAKALPFIRPADIYRRMEEEKDKERRSQESSRPSFESAASRIRESSVASHRTGTDPVTDLRATEATDEPDTTRRLQPTLPPVAERKSEYGFDNVMQSTDRDQPSSTLNRTDTDLSKASAASSDYTNRPDPTSASTVNSRQSPFDALAESAEEPSAPAPPIAPFLLPAVRGVSDFGSDMFSQRNDPSPQSQLQLSKSTTAPRGDGIMPAAMPGSNLQHQNSEGYRSMVNQAFDQSQQDQVPQTPVSMSDSIARSNSASASDISAIARNYEPPASQPTILEELNSRPGTSGTQNSVGKSMDKELPAPPAIVPGYRRDNSPMSSGNPDRRPLSITTADIPKSEHVIPSAATSSTASWDKDSEQGRLDRDVPLMTNEPALPPAVTSSHPEKPSELSRTASEDWQNWEKSRKQFKTQHGVQDSMPSTPGVPSPISRTESPSKGTVRDIASKLESNSGKNSPVNLEPSRPSNARLESFRPSLPGGWQSYNTNTGSATPQYEAAPRETQPRVRNEEPEEDYPKAGPPKDHSAYTKTSNTAFEALAASGSALAGAFGFSQAAREQNQSLDSSHENSRTSTSMSNNGDEAAETASGHDRELETIPEGDRSPISALPPAPLPKDTPSEIDTGHSTLGYFPAPLSLRQSRGPEQLTTQRPTLPASLSTETSPQDDDNDRLRKEIVKSLTPKSSRFDESSRLSPGRDAFPITSGSQRTVSTLGDSNLPKEYDSYWNESNTVSSREAALAAKTPIIPPVLETKAVDSNAEADMPAKTTIEQRFSWETAGEQTPPAGNLPAKRDSLQGQASPEIVKAPTFSPTSARTSAPSSAPISATNSTPVPADPLLPSSQALRPAPSANTAEHKEVPQIVETAAFPTPNAAFVPTSPTLTFKERPVKDVLALNSTHDRIRAFDSHRQHYATNEDGGLAQWLQTVGSSHPEHGPVMSANGVPTIRDDGTELHRPSPARLATKFRMPSSSYTGTGETSGSKQYQEDGKRLLQAGGKLGKKGGLAAKGLLAKAKEKARAVSSSDKGALQNRRRSSQFGATPSPAEDQVQHSSHPSAPPQIPSQKLEISPVDHNDWALPYGTPRDDRKPDWETTLPSATNRELVPDRLGETPSTTKSEAFRDQAESFAAPTSFIGQIIPSNKEQNDALRDSASTTEPLTADRQTLSTLEQVHADPESVPHESHVPLSVAAGVPIAGAAIVAEHKHLPAEHADIDKSNSLAAPHDANSMISNVSSPSPNPADTEERSRSISPPRRSISNQNGREDTNAPPYTQHFPPTKAAEAEVERSQAEVAQGEEQLPTYEQPSVSGRDIPSRLGENPQIIRVADLSSQRRDEGKPIQARPFSFAGPEALERRTADTPQSSLMGGTLSKQVTNVEVAEVNDDSDEAQNPKSFHRPFGVGQEPRVHEHPAYRIPDLTDRGRMYSTENPLPSARRDQASPIPGQYPQASQRRISQEAEEGYRIPGPYVQSYRSPTGRQNVTPFDTRERQDQPAQGPPHSPGNARDRAAQGATQPNMAALHGRDMGPPAQWPERERSKSRTFGGFFKREKSHTDEQNASKPAKKLRRESFFSSGRNSISSQGSRLGSLRQTPSREQPYRQNSNEAVNQRKISSDLLRSSTGIDDESGRKKRFSGIGGFFGKSSSDAQRGSAMKTYHQNAPMQQTFFQQTHQQHSQGVPQQQIQHAATSGPAQPVSGRPVNEPPYRLRTTDSYRTSNTAPIGGRNGSNDRQYPVSAFPHGPDSVMSGRGGPSPYMQSPSHDHGFIQNPTGAYSSTVQQSQPFDQRPQDLRINTGPNSNYLSASVNPAMRNQSPNKNSYTHNYPSTRAPNSAGAGTQPINRAIDLHKRSRSPKLGRHSSSEDLNERSHDPAANLGTFSSKSRSPQAADDIAQEKPWAISLPTDVDESRKVLLQRNESTGDRGVFPVAELPGSKANGYESEEEIIMSATAMPGDLWMMPDAMDYAHGRYDD